MARVFLSYARDDAELAKQLAGLIGDAGHDALQENARRGEEPPWNDPERGSSGIVCCRLEAR